MKFGKYHRRPDCRLCASPSVKSAFSLLPTPLANSYLPPERKNEEDPVYPLDLFLCGDCGHLQLLDVVDPGVLF
jgi:hypothetical protein